MARLVYECDIPSKGDNSTLVKSLSCAGDKYCLYCTRDPTCCLFIQRRPPKHFWEAWYFWFGVAFLMLILLAVVATYLVNVFKPSIQDVSNGTWASALANDPAHDDLAVGRNTISINVIPASGSSGMLSSHKKIMLIAPHTHYTHLTPIVA